MHTEKQAIYEQLRSKNKFEFKKANSSELLELLHMQLYREEIDLRITVPNVAIPCDTNNEEALVHLGTFNKTLKASL